MRYYGDVTRSQQKRSRKYRWLFLVIIIIVVLLVCLFFYESRKNNKSATEGSNGVNANNQATEQIQDFDTVKAKYLFSGTVVPARAVENEARKSDGSIDYNQPFSKLDTFNPSQYDAWTIDNECAITDANIPYRQQVTNTVFNCRPEFLPAMKKYFTVLNFANNHVYDQGSDKFPQMQKYAQDAGFQFLGNQNPAETKDVCEVMSMKVHLNKKDGSSTEGSLPIAFCAWHYFERQPYPGEFDVMKKYAEIMPVVGLMQVGQEYVAKAGSDQEFVGRSIIDGGAEFVIGNSPHWVQNSDVYKNKLIFYSTGNFIFDQLDKETNRGASIEVNMKIKYDENVAKWLTLGDKCKTHYDDCLKLAQDLKLKKIKPTFTYGLVASTTGYKQLTQKADSVTQQEVEERANWQETLKKLGQR